jgi:iron complex outermembrane receptor protein
MVIKRGTVISIAALVATLAGNAPAVAQDPNNAGGIEEVVVTAQRREQSLQDVPLSVTAVSAADLVARGVTKLADLQPGSVPGLFVGQFAGTPSVLAINMRGVGLSDPSQGTVELPVPVYIDGVYLGRGQGLGLELIEPERIEILRGPQGQLFGRNAEGGVVQFVSRKPSGEFGVSASASFGNYSDHRYRLAIDLPEANGFSAQLSAIKSEHDAYTKITPAGVYASQTDHGLLDAKGYRAAIRYKNDGGFTADYSYDNSDTTDSQPALTWESIGIPVNGLWTAFGTPASTDYPSTVPTPVFNTPFKVKTSGHALTLTWPLSDAITLKSITSYRKASRNGAGTLTGALPAGLTANATFTLARFFYPNATEVLDQDQTSQEFQFVGGWDNFDLTAGGFYFKEKVDDQRRSFLTGDAFQFPLAVFSPNVGFCAATWPAPCLVGDNRQRAESTSYGLYAQGSFRPASLDDRLEIDLGLRYTNDKKDALRYFVLGVPSTNIPAKFKASRVDPALTVSYKWTDNVNAYFRYAVGYRAGGVNVRSPSFTSFDVEENEAFELGLKTLLANRRVQLNVALFANKIKGEQLTIQERPTTNPSLTNTINSPIDKKVKGVEAELIWRASDALSVGANFAFMDSDKFYTIANPFGGNAPTRFYQVFTPENSASLFLDANKPLSVGRLAFHTDYSYTSDMSNTPGAIVQTVFNTPGYTRPRDGSSQLAARLSWQDIKMGNGALEVALWGKNLTDDSSIIYGFDGCALGTGFCAYRAVPRMYGLELRFKN